MGEFTAEEIILMKIYDSHDRTQLINDLKDCIPHVIYPDEIAMMRNIVKKLEKITDGEYADMGLFPELISYEREA